MEFDQIRDEIKHFICAELLQNSEIDLDTHAALIKDGYLDSFKLAQLWLYMENRFAIAIDSDELMELVESGRDNIQDLTNFIMARIG